MNRIIQGKSEIVLQEFPENYFDSCVTDPPYGLKFMGKKWDYQVPSVDIWREIFRVLKPGAHVLSFGGDRTEHRMKCNIEDAGFEIRTTLAWIFGSGFPKSLNIGKIFTALLPVDLRCACEPRSTHKAANSQGDCQSACGLYGGQLPLGQGSALKSLPSQADAPGCIHDDQRVDDLDEALIYTLGHFGTDHLSTEDFSLLFERLEAEYQVGGNTLFDSLKNRLHALLTAGRKTEIGKSGKSHSVFGLASFSYSSSPLDGLTRIYHKCEKCSKYYSAGLGTALKPATEIICLARKPLEGTVADNVLKWGTGAINIDGCRIEIDPQRDDMLRSVVRKERESETWKSGSGFKNETNHLTGVRPEGRFPSNVILDEEAARLLDEQSGNLKSGVMKAGTQRSTGGGYHGNFPGCATEKDTPGDSGGASRFFYCAKASREERNSGLEGLEETPCGMMEDDNYPIKTGSGNLRNTKRQNYHPTVKPISLIRYLCRLITPPKGIILDPFAGSGTTGLAATDEGFHYVLIEKEAEFHEISVRRNQAGPLFEAAL